MRRYRNNIVGENFNEYQILFKKNTNSGLI